MPRFDFTRPFRNAVEKAGIDNFRFHDLRHTFASHLLMSGVDLMTVKELLGHASVTMTMRYSHLAPDHRMRAIKTLDTAYPTDTNSDTVETSGGINHAK
ncbi:MAG: site-specific integrase [Acidobacteria bacterium]|nr:site-specific integrase [Acidobacteriota bacterium]